MLDHLKQRINSYKESVFFKLLLIGGVTILLLIPVDMVNGLISERHSRLRSATWDISSTWGKEQVVGGPILTIPYTVHHYATSRNDKGEWYKTHSTTIENALFLANKLKISGNIIPEIRYRGIFKVPVYKSDLQFSGDFLKPDFSKLTIEEKDVLWDKAFISIYISDKKGIKTAPVFNFAEYQKEFGPVMHKINGLDSLIQTDFPEMTKIKNHTNQAFSFNLNLSGSQSIHFLPFGKQTQVQMNSDWKTPKFSGAYLPETRSIDENGFSANWSILELARSYPQQWKETDFSGTDLTTLKFGTEFIFPVSVYLQTTRAVKYAVLFIVLTFLSFFLFETLGNFRIHPVQYLLVGFAICLFYVNLLSISEWFSFSIAYLLASLSITVLIFGYSLTVLKGNIKAAIMSAILIGLYSFLYVLLLAENYSLLMGSIGLFVILGVIMYVTKNLDWYGDETSTTKTEPT